MMVLSLLVLSTARAQGDVKYRFSGVYTWGKIISMLCDDGWCRTALPRDFYTMEVPVSIYENSLDSAFAALKMQAKADGYTLAVTGREKPYVVRAYKTSYEESAYISCIDSTVKTVPTEYLRSYVRADSLKCLGLGGMVDTSHVVPLDRFRVNFYVVSSSFLDDVGIDWPSMWASGNLWSTPHFVSDWALKAVASGDSLSEFRTIEIDIDSSAALHWGSQLKEEKSTYQTGETVRTDYDYHDYGLTLSLTRSEKGGIRGEYKLAQRDDLNSIIEGNFGGGGKDSVSTFGVYDSYRWVESGVPVLRELPGIGRIFRADHREKVKSFFVIEIVQLKKIMDNPSRFDVLDSIRYVETGYRDYVSDSGYVARDTVSDSIVEVKDGQSF